MEGGINKIKKCFLILELPPPVHGMTYINEIINNDLENDDNYFIHPEVSKLRIKQALRQ